MTGVAGANVGSRMYPRCKHCGGRIEHCFGAHGMWKHSVTNRELGDDGHVAAPTTPEMHR